VRELLWILDAFDLEGADTDPVVRNAEANATLGQPMRRKELLERIGERVGITQLSADDNAGLERSARNLLQLGRAVVRHPRRGKLRGADLEADETPRALRAALALDLRLLDLRSLRLLRLLGLAFRLRLRLAFGLHLRRLVTLLAEGEILLPERHVRLVRSCRRQIRRGRRRGLYLGRRRLLALLPAERKILLPEGNLGLVGRRRGLDFRLLALPAAER